MFLKSRGIARALNEQNAKIKITETAERQLIDGLADFIIDRFGYYPNREQKIDVCKAAVRLFPYLYVKRSKIGGIV